MRSFALHDEPRVLRRRRRFHELSNNLTRPGERQIANDLVALIGERLSEEVTVDYLRSSPELTPQTVTEAWVEFYCH